MSSYISASRRSALRRRFVVTLWLLMMPTIVLGATRWGGGSAMVIDAVTKQPVAGVRVLVWLNTTYYGGLPWSRSSRSCGPEYLAVSDSNGKLTIPDDALDEPYSFTLGRPLREFHVAAYKRDYDYVIKSIGGVVNSIDHGATKTGPLDIRIEVMKDTRSVYYRALELQGLTMAGCSCGEYYAVTALELRLIEKIATQEYRKRHPNEVEMPGLGPRRYCQEQ